MAELGLTCRDAFVAFSQNETLRLHAHAVELKERLSAYELPEHERIFGVRGKIVDDMQEHMQRYIFAHFQPVSWHDWSMDNVWKGTALCSANLACEFEAQFYLASGSKAWSKRKGMECSFHFHTAVFSYLHAFDKPYELATEDQCSLLLDFIEEHLHRMFHGIFHVRNQAESGAGRRERVEEEDK